MNKKNAEKWKALEMVAKTHEESRRKNFQTFPFETGDLSELIQ